MNRSATAPSRFWLLVAGSYLAALAVGAVAENPLVSYAHGQAARYAQDAARQTASNTALLELQTAQVLDPGNSSYRQQLANHYVARGNLSQAVAVLGSTDSERIRKAGLLIQLGRFGTAVATVQGVSGETAAVVRSQAYLEEGRGGEAISALENASSDPRLVQLALCQAAAGNAAAIQPLVARADSPVTQQRLRQIESGGLGLAQELYVQGLYQTTARVLATLPDSTTKYILLTHIALNRQPVTHQDLLAAQNAAQQGIKLNPASLPLHSLLQSVDSQLGDQAGVTREQQLIDELQSGKI
jgi:tetratricopeptide (TPR) repeat protein